MAEFTKEQLIEELERRLAVTTHYPDFEEAQLDAQIFKIALEALTAGMEQEPVAWLLSGGGAKNNVSFDSGNAYADPLREVTPLYTAPPAPVVPEEATPENVEMLSGYVSTYKLTDSERDIAAEIWNACRAAMLQSGNFRENKDSSTNNFRKIPEASTSSPVTPDGWISCSDRMPEMGERQYYVLAADFKNNYPPSIPNTQVGVYGDWFNDGNPTWDDGDGEDLHLKEVTHWMPLPEPPQEVK